MNKKDLEIFTWDKIDGDIVFYENEAMIDYDDVVELLNENNQLKSDLKWWSKTAEARLKEIDRLRKENEELKTYKKNVKKFVENPTQHNLWRVRSMLNYMASRVNKKGDEE